MANGTQLSDMTVEAAIPSGSFVPFVVTSQATGLDPAINYRYDIGADLLTRVSYTALALPTAATQVGTSGPSTVQLDLDARPTSVTLAASAGSALIGFLQAGTGATARSVQAKLREPVSARDFGAVGDGVTDDIAAIDLAASAHPQRLWAGGGGVYYITADLPVGWRMLDGTILDSRMVTAQDEYSVLALGYFAGEHNTYIPEQHPASGGRFFASGNHNVYLGYGAARFNAEGRRNTVIGSRSGMGGDPVTPSTFFYCTLIGSHAGEKMTDGESNVGIGVQSLQETTTGNGNTAVGTTAGNRITVGFNNTFIGYLSGTSNAVLANINGGSYNCTLGYRALYVLENGTNNVAVGADAGVSLTTGSNNVFAGRQAGQNMVADSNIIAIGNRSLVAANGMGTSVAIGTEAGQAYSAATQVTIAGFQVAYAATTASSLTAFGYRAAFNLTTGVGNTAIGNNAGLTMETGNNNTMIGNSTSTTASATNSTSLGNGATCTGDNQVTLGNASITALRCQQTSITALSDQRLKSPSAVNDGLLDPVAATTLILSLPVRDYTWLPEAMAGRREVGVFAQELHTAAVASGLGWLGLVSPGTDGDDMTRLWEATPGKLLFPLIATVQQQAEAIASLKARVAALEAA